MSIRPVPGALGNQRVMAQQLGYIITIRNGSSTFAMKSRPVQPMTLAFSNHFKVSGQCLKRKKSQEDTDKYVNTTTTVRVTCFAETTFMIWTID